MRFNSVPTSCLLVLLCAALPAVAATTAAPTTTTLTITAANAPVKAVPAGTVVTLTATVQSGGAVVTPGTVNFCDASVTYCTDIHLIGTAQLTSAGTATLRFVPGVGSHSYKAVFVGTIYDSGSTSSAATLTAAGSSYPSATGFVASGSGGNYTLTATVGGTAGTAPNGQVSFVDKTNGNAVLATATLGGATAGQVFINPPSQLSLVGAVGIGDFNGDGIPDIAATSPVAGAPPFGVFLNDGNGGFTNPIRSSLGHDVDDGFVSAHSIATGDFNGDGKLDLVLSVTWETSGFNNIPMDTVAVLLGNGDGSFEFAGVVSLIGETLLPLNPIGDFNGDGILDLATSFGQGGIKVMLGDGTGGFQSAPGLAASVAVSPQPVIADFNGDGFLDVATLTGPSNALVPTVLLGDGSGRFPSQVTSNQQTSLTNGIPTSVAAGDFNGDGILDLAVADSEGVLILLGKGDGTFITGSRLESVSSSSTSSIVVSDFNGDGKTDLALSSSPGITVFLGNGDGTFVASGITATAAVESVQLGSGDFNGDGVFDLVTTLNPMNNGYTQPVGILLSETQFATAGASISLVPGSGNHEVVASYPSQAIYIGSTSSSETLFSEQGTPSVVLTSQAPTSAYGSPNVFTATVSGAGLPPTGNVYIYDGTALLTSVTLSKGEASEDVRLGIGAHSVTASYLGDSHYHPATSAPVTVTITIGAAAITLSSSENPAPQGTSVAFAAKVVGGAAVPTGRVTFLDGTTQLGAATVIGGTANLSTSTLSQGSHSITATYSGDSNYSPAASQVLTQVIGSLTPATPVFSIPPGAYNKTQTVSITTTTTGATIRYTVDNTTPTPTSPTYSAPIQVAASETVQAIAVTPDGSQSAVASSTYVINSTAKIDFSKGFAQASGPMHFNGSTAISGTSLQLTDSPNQAGTAFYATPINIQAFTTDFTFQLTDAAADGFTFTIQNAGPTALGGNGSGLGFVSIQNSVAIKFDLHNNLGEGPNSTGLYLWGTEPTVPAIDLTGTGIDLHSGDPMTVHMTYNIGYGGDQLVVTITDAKTAAKWTNSFAIDIPAKVSGDTAYVGFTGGTGVGTATQQIQTWTFVPQPPN